MFNLLEGVAMNRAPTTTATTTSMRISWTQAASAAARAAVAQQLGCGTRVRKRGIRGISGGRSYDGQRAGNGCMQQQWLAAARITGNTLHKCSRCARQLNGSTTGSGQLSETKWPLLSCAVGRPTIFGYFKQPPLASRSNRWSSSFAQRRCARRLRTKRMVGGGQSLALKAAKEKNENLLRCLATVYLFKEQNNNRIGLRPKQDTLIGNLVDLNELLMCSLKISDYTYLARESRWETRNLRRRSTCNLKQRDHNDNDGRVICENTLPKVLVWQNVDLESSCSLTKRVLQMQQLEQLLRRK